MLRRPLFFLYDGTNCRNVGQGFMISDNPLLLYCYKYIYYNVFCQLPLYSRLDR